MATVQNAIDRAVERSNLNDPTLIATDELIAYVSLYEQNAYLAAARGNPNYFGREASSAIRQTYGGTWDLNATPGGIAAVSRVEVEGIQGTLTSIAVGDEVSLVDIRHPEHGMIPRAYLRNRVLHPYNSELSSSAANYVSTLKVWYSHLPPKRTATTDTLDLPDEHLGLVSLPLAKILAVRDQRPEEATVLDAEYQLHFATFILALSVYDEGTIRSLEAIPASSHKPSST